VNSATTELKVFEKINLNGLWFMRVDPRSLFYLPDDVKLRPTKIAV
jgi:hypothetical protein